MRFPYNVMLRSASSNVKKLLWDREYRSGKWNRIDDTRGDCIYRYLEKYAANGSILDLGCGPGNTANELSASAYRSYSGVDISDVALDKAKWRTQQNSRADKNRFANADFLSYVPDQQFDVILLRESIYHVPLGRIKEIFDRYSPFLTPTGVFVVRLVTDNRLTSNARVRIIETNCDIVEKGQHSQDGLTVLVFRPKHPVMLA